MEKEIHLIVKKDLDSLQQLNILKLKGKLISKGYTAIIHILDRDDDFHINSFVTNSELSAEVQAYILSFISDKNLGDAISLNF